MTLGALMQIWHPSADTAPCYIVMRYRGRVGVCAATPGAGGRIGTQGPAPETGRTCSMSIQQREATISYYDIGHTNVARVRRPATLAKRAQERFDAILDVAIQSLCDGVTRQGETANCATGLSLDHDRQPFTGD